jgi:hypothetical protein
MNLAAKTARLAEGEDITSIQEAYAPVLVARKNLLGAARTFSATL